MGLPFLPSFPPSFSTGHYQMLLIASLSCLGHPYARNRFDGWRLLDLGLRNNDWQGVVRLILYPDLQYGM